MGQAEVRQVERQDRRRDGQRPVFHVQDHALRQVLVRGLLVLAAPVDAAVLFPVIEARATPEPRFPAEDVQAVDPMRVFQETPPSARRRPTCADTAPTAGTCRRRVLAFTGGAAAAGAGPGVPRARGRDGCRSSHAAITEGFAVLATSPSTCSAGSVCTRHHFAWRRDTCNRPCPGTSRSNRSGRPVPGPASLSGARSWSHETPVARARPGTACRR